jgi:hypothetical protein
MQWREMHSGGMQTDQVIHEADLIEKHQKQMVLDNQQTLADNRKAIADVLEENRAELDAALQQNRQALEATAQQSKTAMDASIATARTDQRAWVGVVGVKTTGGVASENGLVKDATFGVQSVSIVLRNSGRTPSLKMAVKCCFMPTKLFRDPIPDYDTMDADRKKGIANMAAQRLVSLRGRLETSGNLPGLGDYLREEIAKAEKDLADPPPDPMEKFLPTGGVLAPDIPSEVTVVQSTQWGTRVESRIPSGLPVTIYILGKIVYRDIFTGTPERSTKFCLMRPTGNQFVICPSGNWME